MKIISPLSILLIILQQLLFAQQTDTSRYYVSFDGAQIHYEIKGNGAAVVLLHGFTGTIKSWKQTPLYADLVKAGYKVIVPDMRGNGLSDKPHIPEAYAHDAEARDIMGIVSELQLSNYMVIGYSRGSIIGSRLLVNDNRVSKAVLGGMGADFMNPEWPRRMMFYKALAGKPTPQLEGFMKYVKDSGFDQVALMYLQKSQPFTTREEFATVKKPVLILCGDVDEDNGSSKDLASLIPNAEYKRVPGDHNGTAKTKAFGDVVMAFIRK
jgi:pimeloyl-ACP methyl ester carboxylesterase